MRRIVLSLIILFIYLVTFTNLYAGDAHQDDSDIIGKKDFITYCASCHGSGGKGDGPIVNYLKRKPVDLTQLTKNNDGSFPFDRIYGVFDGTYVFNEHGTSEMPIWGYNFIEEAKAGKKPSATAKAKVLDIILYIQVIQE